MSARRRTRTGSLRFARSAVTSHVERDHTEGGAAGPGPCAPPDAGADRIALFSALRDAAPGGQGLHGRIEDVHGTTTADGPAGGGRTGSLSRRTVLVTSASGGHTRTRAEILPHGRADPAAHAAAAARLVPETEDLPPYTGAPPSLVLFEPMAFAELIAEFAAVAMAAHGPGDTARVRRDWAGTRVARPGLTVTDDPAALGGWSLDTEGTPAAPLTLVEDGVIVGCALDRACARAMGRAPTGHASREVPGLTAYPANLVIGVPPAPDPAGPLLRVERVHYVSVVDAAGGTLTAATRDFTTVVESGRAVATVPSIRFTVRIPHLLLGIAGGLGPARTVPVSWGGCAVRSPAVLVADLPLPSPNTLRAE
ncbi:metallopeptidase TldD-related protein [Streptomyces sp. CAU 1734]|uniref:metallopeptidase TldD-related protein n=1 Tax=Streptomyces sp. CAU 1734 TaxID=3140360 RepID=UPI003260CC52